MAHPPDPALMRAIGSAIHELRGRWSVRELAEQLGVVQPTISRWENGNRMPPLDLLPRLDKMLGRPRGELLRRAGYVSDDLDVVSAIRSDAALSDEQKATLIGLYETMLKWREVAG